MRKWFANLGWWEQMVIVIFFVFLLSCDGCEPNKRPVCGSDSECAEMYGTNGEPRA